MHRLRFALFPTAALVALLALSLQALAQSPDLAAAQQRYERQLAYCNSGQLPDPERNACVRDAGLMLDRARGGRPPSNAATTSEDGRATIIGPAGLPPPNSGSDAITSGDGRSTIIVPADAPSQ